jgi:predicted membrane-bound spermidine synthase
MKNISVGLLLVALATLMLELTLIRVFDVIWYANMSYMVITLAMFCFGLAGVYVSLKPRVVSENPRRLLSILAFLVGLFALALLPAINLLPFDFNLLYKEPYQGALLFGLMYFFLGLPFFISGLVFTILFSCYSKKIQILYFWDLVGAALGCVLLVPFLPVIGPGGILFLICGISLTASAIFSENRNWSKVVIAAGLLIAAIPFFHDGYFEFKDHIQKRGVMSAKSRGNVEMSYWDPVSKIDVIEQNQSKRKHIAYDGGTQSSFIFPFNGDYKALRESMPDGTRGNFGGQNVYISHYIKRDTDQKVLVIGSAAGQETKTALMYGAAHVDTVELVGFVVKLGKEDYAKYNGNIFNHPNVNAMVGEGRSYLRSISDKYDIIQMFSNHTSSSIAAGTGAMATTYLQTKEAYMEYFNHLNEDGILHINHHIYPRMITTAALAWKEMGRKDFRNHVLIFQAGHHVVDTLPTMLIKMTKWTKDEVDQLRNFFEGHTGIVEDPVHPEESFLPDEFYSGTMSDETLNQCEYYVQGSTDDRPYFNFIRKKSFKRFSREPGNYMTYSTAAILNKRLKRSFFPKDTIHLFITGFASLFFALVFIFVPLLFARTGKEKWGNKKRSLLYFSCLGAGFIIFELVFIQIFMKLIGYPLYTYSSVVFAILLAAGTGSYCSGKMAISPVNRWYIPFLGILFTGTLLIISHQTIFNIFLQSSQSVRILVSMIMIFPLGFFLGMPFPLGILAIEGEPTGAVAWAWAMNGLFTVIGGIMSVLLSIFYGFKVTMTVALIIYLVAFYTYSLLRKKHISSV